MLHFNTNVSKFKILLCHATLSFQYQAYNISLIFMFVYCKQYLKCCYWKQYFKCLKLNKNFIIIGCQNNVVYAFENNILQQQYNGSSHCYNINCSNNQIDFKISKKPIIKFLKLLTLLSKYRQISINVDNQYANQA